MIAPYTPDYNFEILGHTDYKGHETKDLYKEWNDETTKTFIVDPKVLASSLIE